MNEWYFDRYGQASFIVVENERFVSKYGRNLGWIHQSKQVFSLTGQPLGWLEKGVLRDRKGGIIAFARAASSWLPSIPGMSGEPAAPSIPGPPARPGFAGTIVDPGSGSWASVSIRDFFGADL
ncbi:hypothetical protein J4772_16935 [Cohnella sp. LGH]|uniref:4-fold beta flower domain-containing protein n=1 Tax=Cohnella phaseoli TaxID=456490 RepID=A0A3D9KJ48_9BACL|nr:MULTISPECIES: hypothetical protein [Cohnella]QTH45962.1 hypothetical protein J4772_16935 [Cohnella sp. LGH]RED86330.1 hypothetical protein DFP98_103184 [Cohnella phaseoli]